MRKYNHQEIEKKWQEKWEQDNIFDRKEDNEKKYFYILDMFPYPSGDGLHMGHTESYTASDIFYRYKKMQGFNVLHPQGFDSFGLPAENYAIKTGTHPKETTEKNMATYVRQLKSLGLGHDFKNLVITSTPEYFQHTQFLFGKFFENNFIKRKTDQINYCPSCNTGIANEQVENGKCERCQSRIEQKKIPGWFFKITDFAEDLIKDLDTVNWPEHTKINQKNWIGKSEGAIIKFKILIKSDASTQVFGSQAQPDHSQKHANLIEVFTTRPDTLFGVTYLVLAPEYNLVQKLKSHIINFEEIEKYKKDTKKKSELERLENKEKTGIEIKGIKAINPVNNEEVPVFISDYVLGDYGTGAIMAVPSHDERDYEFAKKFKLPIIERELVNKKEIVEKVGGKIITNYHLRDWSISRQRYWGTPIPIVYSPEGEAKFVGAENLPWLLPEDVDFIPDGTAPLEKSKELLKRTEKLFGAGWRPEVDTMDTFVDSAWYFLRYPDSKNNEAFCSPEILKKWLPKGVDIYIGGAEHTYMHLLYARFFIKAMHKMGLINFNEPFQKLRHQGMVLDKNRIKMSKSKGNVVNPDKMVKKFGADSVRTYMMFAAPLEDDVIWNEDNIIGVYRFLEKVWNLQFKVENEENKKIKKILNKTIKKVGEQIENLKYNTVVSDLMKFVNSVSREEKINEKDYEDFLKLLSPFAPHITDELSGKILLNESWPKYDEKLIPDEKIIIPVQINGKRRGELKVSPEISEKEILEEVQKNSELKKWLGDENIKKKIKKVIYISKKIINLVI